MKQENQLRYDMKTKLIFNVTPQDILRSFNKKDIQSIQKRNQTIRELDFEYFCRYGKYPSAETKVNDYE